jgi:hypothetical protein
MRRGRLELLNDRNGEGMCERALGALCGTRCIVLSCVAPLVWCSCALLAPLTPALMSVQALVGILTALVLGISVLWFRLWLTQITYDSKVLMPQLLLCVSAGFLKTGGVS